MAKGKIKMKKKDLTKIVMGIIVLLILAVVVLFLSGKKEESNDELDQLAKCLTSNGAKMFGASWCGHCNNQKKMFGESWKYVNYVECSLADGSQSKECEEAGIEAYPTWIINGHHYLGEQSLEDLRQLSGCV